MQPQPYHRLGESAPGGRLGREEEEEEEERVEEGERRGGGGKGGRGRVQ